MGSHEAHPDSRGPQLRPAAHIPVGDRLARLRLVAEWLLIGIGVAGVAALVSRVDLRYGEMVGFWPVGGIALAALMGRGLDRWPGVFIGSVLVGIGWALDTGIDPLSALPAIAASAGGRSLLTVLCARWLGSRAKAGWLHQVRGVWHFLLVAGLVYPLLMTGVSFATVAAAGHVLSLSALLSWFVVNSAGTVLVAPPLLLASSHEHARVSRSRWEAIACGVAIVGVSAAIFRPQETFLHGYPPIFLLTATLVWAALRFHVRGAVWGLLAASVVIAAAIASAQLPNDELAQVLARIQLYLVAEMGMVLTLAAAIEERHQAVIELERSRGELAQRVAERTGELRAERDFSRLAIETSGALIAVSDLDGKLIRWNAALEQAVARTSSEIEGASIRSWVPAEQRDHVAQTMGRLRMGSPTERFEAALVATDGSVRQVNWTGTGIPGPDGSVSALLGIGIDVTDRERARRELEQSLSLLLATIESTADGILVVDRAGRVHTWNSRFAELWRMPRSVLESGSDESVIAAVIEQVVDAEVFVERARAIYSTPELESSDVIHLRDGRIFERSSRPQRIGDEIVGRVWSFRDATRRRKAEADRDRLFVEESIAREAAERAFLEADEAIRIREDFLAIASHEMKTPLTSLRAQVQQVQRLARLAPGGNLDAARLQPMLTVGLRQLDRIQGLIDDLLDLSRLTSGEIALEPEELDLSVLAELQVEQHREAAERVSSPISLDVAGAVTGSFDRLRLEQLLGVLLSNAIKFGAGRPISVRVFERDGMARLQVIDRGIGIAAEDQERIFGRFERAVDSRNYGGFGIGLWIARRIVEAMGGGIAVESASGRGSVFTVGLPVRHTPANHS